MPRELGEPLHKQISSLTDEGNQLARDGQYAAAKERFWQAFDLIPEPKADWQATTWILAAIGDMWFFLGDYTKAQLAFADAVGCPGGLGNPFIHLRLGELGFEAGEMKRAGDELTRAYMGGGRQAFKHEDPKYFSFLEAILPPQG